MAIIPQIITEDRASGAQVIDGSLKFDGDLAYYLTKTLSSVGDQRTFTFSCWCKRSRFGTHSAHFFLVLVMVTFLNLHLETIIDLKLIPQMEVLIVRIYSQLQIFRDTSWYHIVIAFDTTQVTSTNRVKFYVNNTQITDFDLNTYPGQDVDTSVNDNVQHIIGNQVANTRYFDGMISNVYMIDGQQLDPSYFGFTDPLTNTWRPKKFESSINNGTTWSNDLTTANPNSGFCRISWPLMLLMELAVVVLLLMQRTLDAKLFGLQLNFLPLNGPYTLEVLCTGTAANGGSL